MSLAHQDFVALMSFMERLINDNYGITATTSTAPIVGEMSTVDTTRLGMSVFIVFRVTRTKSSPLAESTDSKDLILTPHNNKDQQQQNLAF